MKKVIGIDLDQFRLGIAGVDFTKQVRSEYAVLAEDNWKGQLFKNSFFKNQGFKIAIDEITEPFFWGNDRLYSRRSGAAQNFGRVLDNLDSEKTHALIKTAVVYLAETKPEFFEKQDGKLVCNVCIGVGTQNLSELTQLKDTYIEEYQATIDDNVYSIRIDQAHLVPKTLCAILEVNAQNTTTELRFPELLDGLYYVVDIDDHYTVCDIYEHGNLIKSDKISSGIYEISDRVVQSYHTQCVIDNARPFQINTDMVYDMLVHTEKNEPFILQLNGQQVLDLTKIVIQEFAVENKKIFTYLNKNDNVQYSDRVIIRDLKSEIIDKDSLDKYLEIYGLNCIKQDNKSAVGMNLFGELLWNGSIGEEEHTLKENLEYTEMPILQNSQAESAAMTQVSSDIVNVEENNKSEQVELDSVLKEQEALLQALNIQTD